jgi:hypothetical protein
MKRYYYKVFIPVLLFFLFFPFKSFSQDSTCVNSFEDSPIKKGSWAIAFELGSLLWGYNEYYNENIEMSQKIQNYNILLKYHFSDRSSIRVNFGFNSISLDRSSYIDAEHNTLQFDAVINLQYFLTKKYYAKPFISAGPYYHNYTSSYNYPNENYSYKDKNWELGIIFTAGVEILVYKNIGLIAEHILKGVVEKKHSEVIGSSSGDFTNDKYMLKFIANSFRLGLSLYF